MINNKDKKKLIYDFNLMKGFEQSARDFYTKIYTDAAVENQQIKDAFKRLAKDENQHAEIVQKIIDIINNS